MRRLLSATLAIAGVLTAIPAHATTAPARLGVDVAPGASVPSDAAFAIVQVTGGKGFTTNDSLASQYAAAEALGSPPQLYIVGAQPGPSSANWPRDGDCSNVDSDVCARQYGIALANNALAYADAKLPNTPVVWWIDVEDTATWYGPTDANLAAINGMAEALISRTDRVAAVGIYSNRQQWGEISGNGTVHALVWSGSPTADEATAAANCTPKAAFITGPVVLAQYSRGAPGVSGDVECPPYLTAVKAVPTGRTVTIGGSAFPGRSITLSIRSGGTTSTRTVMSGRSGAFSVRLLARYALTVTATDVAGAAAATFAILPIIGRPDVTTSACRLTARGTVRPYWPGQRVRVRVAGGRGATVTTTRTPSGARWSLTAAQPCGASIRVSAQLVGASHGIRYVKDGTGPAATART